MLYFRNHGPDTASVCQKSSSTGCYASFLAGWAKRLSWQDVAAAFPTSWDTVYRAVHTAVDCGLAHRDLTNIEAIGVDEPSRRRRQRYLTLVYQIDGHCKRLLWVGRDRKAATLEGFFDWFGAARSAALYFVCSDIWKPYLKAVAERAGQPVQVLDRFHIMSHFSKAIDEVRAAEVRKLAAAGKAPVLKHSRWLLLKRPENLTDGQAERLAELVRRNLRTVRAYLLKEDFQSLWGYVSPYWAARFPDRWCTRTMRSPLEPMKDVARMVRSHRDLILNRFRARGQFSSGVVEGFNGQARVITKRANVPHRQSTGSSFMSRTWPPARTRIHPRILLTRPPLEGLANARFSAFGPSVHVGYSFVVQQLLQRLHQMHEVHDAVARYL